MTSASAQYLTLHHGGCTTPSDLVSEIAARQEIDIVGLPLRP